MDLELRGKTVLVTGGSKGIGLACAEHFAREGAKVAIASRAQANLDAAVAALAAKGHAVLSIRADFVHAPEALNAVGAVEERLGPIDVLVNSAGAAGRHSIDELGMQQWHDAMDSKYFTYIHAMQAVLTGMAARGRGAIVNLVGIGGKIASATHVTGGAANAALMLASVGLAAAYGPKGIRVNAINPGYTETDKVQRTLHFKAETEGKSVKALYAEVEKAVPLGRFAQPAEIADVVVFLASARASYISGAVITVDGALTRAVV